MNLNICHMLHSAVSSEIIFTKFEVGKAATLTYDCLTLNVCDVSVLAWPNSALCWVINDLKIENLGDVCHRRIWPEDFHNLRRPIVHQRIKFHTVGQFSSGILTI